MKGVITALALMMTEPSIAGAYHVMDLSKFSFETARLYDNRDAYWTWQGSELEPWATRTAVNFDLDIVTKNGLGLSWSNTVDGKTTDKQFRTVSWRYEVILTPIKPIQLLWHHHSQHLLDTDNYGNNNFPLTNYVGIRYTFYDRAIHSGN